MFMSNTQGTRSSNRVWTVSLLDSLALVDLEQEHFTGEHEVKLSFYDAGMKNKGPLHGR